MSLIARPWSRLSLTGKLVLPLLAILAVLILVLLAGTATGIIPFIATWIVQLLADNILIVRFVIAASLILLLAPLMAFVIIYLEMKVIALMNLRIGPNRVGPWGVLQSTIHGLKVLAKEDFTPTGADVPVFTLAPVVVFLAIVMAALVLPFAPGLYGQDFNIGLLYFFAVGGISVVGVMMGGWSSFNKYSLVGAIRAAVLAISYEIPLTLSVVGVILLAGSMSLNHIVIAQSGNFLDWYVVQQPLAFLIFFIAALAESNRTPFDFTEADSEIVAGAFTEYSGMRFGFFFFAEYVNLLLLSGLTVTLFFGGWNAPISLDPILRLLGIATPFVVGLDFGHLGLGFLYAILLVPPIGTLILSLPVWMLRSDLAWWQALIVGFVLLNVIAIGLAILWLAITFSWVMGLLWFLGKSFFFVLVFIWLRATLPRVRIDQMMGFAWKWLLPAALLNIFVTAAAVLIVQQVH
jgi:NADH-quinone oxidoreductase subunit H